MVGCSRAAARRTHRRPQSIRGGARRTPVGMQSFGWLALAMASWGWAAAPPLEAQDAPPVATGAAVDESAPAPRIELSAEWLRVTKDYEVWVNLATKQVLVGGRICLREGMLEMFACPQGTKEHESIVSVHSPARYVHAALVAIGARPGPPVRFEPTYQPAQGTEIRVEVLWRDRDGTEHSARAQDWVKQVKTGQALAYPWVFAGSGFWTDPDGKEQFYYGDGGELICVSNFSTATLDLPVESSAANEALLFGAYTERIPPRDTPVMLRLTPQLTPPDQAQVAAPAAESPASATPAAPAAAPAAPPTPSESPQGEAASPRPAPAAPPQPEPGAPQTGGSVTKRGGSA